MHRARLSEAGRESPVRKSPDSPSVVSKPQLSEVATWGRSRATTKRRPQNPPPPTIAPNQGRRVSLGQHPCQEDVFLADNLAAPSWCLGRTREGS